MTGSYQPLKTCPNYLKGSLSEQVEKENQGEYQVTDGYPENGH